MLKEVDVVRRKLVRASSGLTKALTAPRILCSPIRILASLPPAARGNTPHEYRPSPLALEAMLGRYAISPDAIAEIRRKRSALEIELTGPTLSTFSGNRFRQAFRLKQRFQFIA